MNLNPPNGALPDNRSDLARAFDYFHDEIVAGKPVPNWLPKKQPQGFQMGLSPDTWRRFPVRQQANSSACVAFTLAKISSVLLYNDQKEYVAFSPASIYINRSNKPQGGMIGADAWNIIKNMGISLDILMPSDNLSEDKINAVPYQIHDKLVAQQFKLRGYVQIYGFEAVASMVEHGTPVMAWFNINGKEWGDFPNLQPGLDIFSGHSVTVVDAVKFDGVAYLVIEDSYGTFGEFPGQRLIDQQYFDKRCFYSAYPRTFTFAPETFDKPFYDGSTVSLQNCLKWAGFFPVDVDSTGVFGPVTTKAVKTYQASKGIDQTGTVGPKTTAALSLDFA